MSPDQIPTLEAKLKDMSDDELRRFYLSQEVESEQEAIAAGMMERRNIDL